LRLNTVLGTYLYEPVVIPSSDGHLISPLYYLVYRD